MGRINAEIVSVTFLAFLVMSMPTLAQESTQKEKPAPTTSAATATKEKHGSWKQRADGIWEAKIPRFADDDEGDIKPEFGVVRLTAARYAEFRKEPKEFVNEHEIFGKKVRVVLESCPAAKPETEETKSGYWYLGLAHWPGSTAACRAYA